ncbi:hypothetical protein [Actibacterium sp. 188UL27-1]|uniref:hypothetical protein n=1 Tax=Actibacterium sp. 188UL27-1 TaxID=2786961 RepID=UPI00195DEDA1|nr:hypothetical protein [Actibacterium sp. 188UL27-1]MBM7069193.1 hypothetical protein [Actibacterium sp. 188UL27-1]
MTETVLARVSPAPARRWFAIAVLGSLGGLILWLALDLGEAGLIQRSVLALFGCAVLAFGYRLWAATRQGLVLTKDALITTNGDVLAQVQQIKRVERGAFAFKPSNGFLVVTNTTAPSVWAPGLWWRFGRRIGVGGVCGAGQTKAMADILAAEIADDPSA